MERPNAPQLACICLFALADTEPVPRIVPAGGESEHPARLCHRKFDPWMLTNRALIRARIALRGEPGRSSF